MLVCFALNLDFATHVKKQETNVNNNSLDPTCGVLWMYNNDIDMVTSFKLADPALGDCTVAVFPGVGSLVQHHTVI